MKDTVHCHALPAVIWLEHQVPVLVAKHLGCVCGVVGAKTSLRLVCTWAGGCVSDRVSAGFQREQISGEESNRRIINCCLSTSQRLSVAAD